MLTSPKFSSHSFLGFHQIVLLFPLYYHKFPKTLLTNSTHGGIFPVNPTDFVDWFETIYKLWSCSFWTQPQKVVDYHRETHHFSEEKSAKEFTAPQHTRSILPPIHPDKIIAALRGRYFFTNKILCGCTIFQNLFLVVDRTTSKCYSDVWKKQNVVSALRPAFFILNLESYISRLNVIPCHDLTLSVGEPDNAAAQTGAGTSFGANGDQHTRAVELSTYFCVLTIRRHL